jgi:single-strand DNA-binding protein
MELIIITGNLAQDSTVTHISKTRSVCNFTVAVNKRYKDKSGNAYDTVKYFECAYWRDAEQVHKSADLLKKGVKVNVVAEDIDSRAFMKNELPVSVIKLEVSKFEILSPINKNS